MIMKRILMLTTVVLLLALGAGTALAQSGYDLFQKALVKERAIGDVEEALRLYQRVVKEFAGDHALAAKAELRMGLLYERLGRKADAQRAYQAVVNHYADQTNEARQARAKIVVVAASPRNINASTKTTTAFTLRQVWTGVGGESAISPDGRYLVYVDAEEALASRDLLTPGKNRRLTTVGPWWDMEETDDPTFSPDGKLVAYLWVNKSRADLRLIALDGSAPRILYQSDEGKELQPFDWSSDGKQILATLSGQNGSHQIVLVSVADGSMHVLKKFDWGFPGRMSLSHDGRYVAYDWQARKDSPEHNIFILDTDGGREIPVVTQAAHNVHPIWTPDGRGVLFLSLGGSNARAWFVRVVDGKPQGSPELVRKDVGWIKPLAFTPNGSFYYRQQSGGSELYVAALDPTSGTVAAQPATVTQRSVTSDADWSPDGQYLAYISGRPSVQGEVGPMIIVIRSFATGEEYELVPALRSFTIRPGSWSPDGHSLLVNGRDKAGRAGLYRVDARTGDIAPLLYNKPGENITHQNWFLDGKSIVFIRNTDLFHEVDAIVSHDLETGRDTDLYRPPSPFLLGSCVEVSRDGQRLAFYIRNQETLSTSVMVISAPGERPRELGPPVKSPEVIDDILALTRDGQHVLFSTYERGKKEEKPHKVWRIAVDGGGPQEIPLPMEKLGYVGDVSFHPDGRRIAFISRYRKSEVWVMDNFLPSTQARKTTASRR
jgi:Tol biopolymer transport system component